MCPVLEPVSELLEAVQRDSSMKHVIHTVLKTVDVQCDLQQITKLSEGNMYQQIKNRILHTEY